MLEAAGWEESGGQKWLQDIDQNGELSMGLAEKLVQLVNTLFNKVLCENKKSLVFLLKTK